MKKIALITTNKILAQSLAAAMKSMPGVEFDLVLLLNSHQALLDAEILEIDVALIDMGLIDIIDNDMKETETAMSLCEKMHKSMPNCHLLLIVPQDDKGKRILATEAKKNKIVEDFVFYDSSLKYLFAKVASF